MFPFSSFTTENLPLCQKIPWDDQDRSHQWDWACLFELELWGDYSSLVQQISNSEFLTTIPPVFTRNTNSTQSRTPENVTPQSSPPHEQNLSMFELCSIQELCVTFHVTSPITILSWLNHMTLCHLPWIVFLSHSRSARQCLMIKTDTTLDQDWGTEDN